MSYDDALPQTVDYRPSGACMWDAWCVAMGGQVHVFHLQLEAAGSTRPAAELDWIGHAVSDDLLHWTELPPALPPNAAGTLDDMAPWTGCVTAHNGLHYLFYTMRATRDQGSQQQIGLATSPDLRTWTRHAANPVITPDPRSYISTQQPLPPPSHAWLDPANQHGVVDCRDLVTVRDPSGAGWFGFYAARIPGEEGPEQSVIATVHSLDLIHWTHRAPAFSPGTYQCLEVPDVFILDGRWYLTCLTGQHYGNRGIMSDPYCTRGTIYAVAERVEGPYREFAGDNVLLGGDDGSCGYSCRTLLVDDGRLALCTLPCPHDAGLATLSPPFTVRSTPEGHLRLGYSKRTEGWRSTTLIPPGTTPDIARLPPCHPQWRVANGRWDLRAGVYHGSSRSGWQIAWLEAAAPDLEVEATILLASGVAAGLAVQSRREECAAVGDVVVALDAREGCVLAGRTLEFEELHRRRMAIATGHPYRLQVCFRRSRCEVYVDGLLLLQFGMRQPIPTGPRTVGLFVDRGQCQISGLAAYALGRPG